jgi:hypothetical protein
VVRPTRSELSKEDAKGSSWSTSSMQRPIKQSGQNHCNVMETALSKGQLVSYYPILTYKVEISASAST